MSVRACVRARSFRCERSERRLFEADFVGHGASRTYLRHGADVVDSSASAIGRLAAERTNGPPKSTSPRASFTRAELSE